MNKPVSNGEGNARRTSIIYMSKKALFDALHEMYDKGKELDPPKYGWSEFRDWIDKTRILLQHGFGVNSDQEREFMQIEYAPNVNGRVILDGSPFQSVKSLAWYSEGITKAKMRLASIMEELATSKASLFFILIRLDPAPCASLFMFRILDIAFTNL